MRRAATFVTAIEEVPDACLVVIEEESDRLDDGRLARAACAMMQFRPGTKSIDASLRWPSVVLRCASRRVTSEDFSVFGRR
jgi:hypothetical protein